MWREVWQRKPMLLTCSIDIYTYTYTHIHCHTIATEKDITGNKKKRMSIYQQILEQLIHRYPCVNLVITEISRDKPGATCVDPFPAFSSMPMVPCKD